MTDTDTCPMHSAIELRLQHQDHTLDDHEARLRVQEAGDRRRALFIGLVTAVCAALGAFGAALLNGKG